MASLPARPARAAAPWSGAKWGTNRVLARILTAATGRGVAKTPDDGVAGELGGIFR